MCRPIHWQIKMLLCLFALSSLCLIPYYQGNMNVLFLSLLDMHLLHFLSFHFSFLIVLYIFFSYFAHLLGVMFLTGI